MPQGLEDIKNTLSRITRGDDILDLLMEFERTLDATEIFSYRNWICGELIRGPEIGRYWFKTSWMYPESLMPDPDGALRLEKIGCIVSFEKDMLMQPRRVLSPKDWKDPKTKEAKIDEIPVWIVNIQMPTKYVTERLDAYNEFLEDEIADYHEKIADEIAAQQEVENEEADEFFDEGGEEDMDLGAFEESIKSGGIMLVEANDVTVPGASGLQQINANWYTIDDLPGGMDRAVRQIGRTIFRTFTSTPIEGVKILASIQGRGPHNENVVNGVAKWAVDHAQEVHDLSVNFGQLMPGYEPEAKLFVTDATTFLLVRDHMGIYVYAWPTSDNLGIYRLEQDTRGELPDLSGE